MQNYVNYIIGILIIGALGVLVYVAMMPGATQQVPDNNLTANQDQNTQQNVDQNTTQSATDTSTTTINNSTTTNTKMETTKKDTYKVTMQTTKGNIILELNSKIAPKTVENFVKLAQSGFYNGVRFHRVIKDFMIQSGDPNSKDDKLVSAWGTGGPGYKFADEIFDQATYTNGYKRGILAMANSGPNTNGSQFFIMHKDTALPPSYTIFGHVLSGLETVDAIANSKTGQADRPLENITISKVTVE